MREGGTALRYGEDGSGMSVRFGIAKATARGLHWGLTHVARRPGANLPGKVALKLDPQAIAEARGVVRRGAILVTGTYGKTTVYNLLADCVQRSGASVCCNRTGANLAYGVASALLECRGADWGVIESDELWLGKSLPALQPRFLVLLNLFRDQLDRCGEIDHIQDVIVEALGKSPDTVLIFNADDPLCAMVAERAAALPGREGTRSVVFGTAEPMHLEQNAVSDTTMCQRCSSMLQYEFRQYGQLGAYRCPQCGFARPALDFAATNIRFTATDLTFDVSRETCETHADETGEQRLHTAEDVSRETSAMVFPVHTHLAGSYMVYNMLAVAAAATCMGCSPADIQAAIDAFDPHNGRLQEFSVGSHRTLLNLAKNPTGFNQNLRIVVQQALAVPAMDAPASDTTASNVVAVDAPTSGAPAPSAPTSGTIAPSAIVPDAAATGASESPACAIAFFINDRDVDGHDISWIWDIDFEELGRLPHARVFAGGERKHDLQVRLKYAGVQAELIETMEDVFAAIENTAQRGAVRVDERTRMADGVNGEDMLGRTAGGGANAAATSSCMLTDADVYAIANYTALAPVRAELERLQKERPAVQFNAAQSIVSRETSTEVNCSTVDELLHNKNAEHVSRETLGTCEGARGAREREPVVIAHLFPDLLNLYGDGGNVRILEQRLRWRGIPVEVRRVEHGQTINFDEVDLLFLGGGPDREQTLAAEQLMGMREGIARYVEEGGPVLAICGGYQILGHTWLSPDGEAPGLGVLDIETRRAGTSTDRLIDNIALASPTAEHPVIGYENHASRTYLGAGVQPFGRVISRTGHGNNDADHADGALYRNVLGTYLHGTLLAKNPEVADWLLERALSHNALRTGAPTPIIEPLDDAVELAANAALAAKLIPKGAEMGVQRKLKRVEQEFGASERRIERKIEQEIAKGPGR